MATLTADTLHLLSIDLSSAPSSLRAVLELGQDDVEHWLKRARAAGAPLAIVCGPEHVDLYSSEAGRRAAFKPLLESIWSLGRHLEDFQRIKTREAYGHAAVRHLLRQAAGLESTEHGLSYANCIDAACAQARRLGTLSDGLGELFQVASSTALRSGTETEISAPFSTRASRQLEALSAERIVEEELLAFQVATASIPAPAPAASGDDASTRATLPARARRSFLPGELQPYTSSEPSSCVRMRASTAKLPAIKSKLG
jgi:hypothetical protein